MSILYNTKVKICYVLFFSGFAMNLISCGKKSLKETNIQKLQLFINTGLDNINSNIFVYPVAVLDAQLGTPNTNNEQAATVPCFFSISGSTATIANLSPPAPFPAVGIDTSAY